jgi:hypothetical protein
LQLSFKRDRCWFFDLARDPYEQRRKECLGAVQPQLIDLLRFWRFQSNAPQRYNDTLPQ